MLVFTGRGRAVTYRYLRELAEAGAVTPCPNPGRRTVYVVNINPDDSEPEASPSTPIW